MKKMILMAVMLMSMAAVAQEPVMTFEKTTHDFGKINEADGRVTTVFEFKNEGMAPLVLSNVRASCGCTTPQWTKEPIEPGQTGNITVTYNPNGRPGRFQKSITVTSNASAEPKRLYIKGEVIPKPAKPTEQYPITMGALKLKTKSLNFGVIKNTTSGKLLEIEYANTTDSVLTVGLACSETDTYIKPSVSLKELKPSETGKLQFALQPADCPLWGPVESKAYVIVNGKLNKTDEYTITLKANIQEDFSQMTVEEQQQAPIVEISREINLGVIPSGKKFQGKVSLSNAGVNPLSIRRVYTNDANVSAQAPKAAIKSGKKIAIPLTINALNMPVAQYTRIMTVITNDPKAAIIQVKINWTVE